MLQTAAAPKIAVARLWFEGNSFSPTPTGPEALPSREWVSGQAALARYAGTGTELGGLARFLEARPNWQATVLRCASAQPGGPLTRAVFEEWLEEILAGLAQGAPWDGVYLSRHGACVAEHLPAADLHIVRRVRQVSGMRLPRPGRAGSGGAALSPCLGLLARWKRGLTR